MHSLRVKLQKILKVVTVCVAVAILGISLASPASASVQPRKAHPVSISNCHKNSEYSFCVRRHNSADPSKARALLEKASKRSPGDSDVKPYGTEPDPDPSTTVPDLCYAPEPESATRFDQCTAAAFTLTLYHDQTPVGTMQIQTYNWATLSPTSLTWDFHAEVIPEAATGILTAGTQMSATGACLEATCYATGWQPPDGWVPLNLYEAQHGVTEITADIADQATIWADPYEYLEFSHPDATSFPQTAIYMTPARCDSVSPDYQASPGCVYLATLTFTESASGNEADSGYTPAPENAQFIQSEQQAHPEWGVTQPIHRRYNPEFNSMIRDQNCQGFEKQFDDDSCDEFPFASTYENTGPGTASVGHVSLADNTAGGRNLSKFLRANRILDYDSYYVQIVD